ncbi:phospholipid/cholesterol/gamma-HCH transport system substrate-binding protein [Pseudonocardia thermophila]|uniref:Phospholipid/cholesterol/gamma-HCH transport system substrate-binding protein n=1 Tax=Pseudonocardia thermophila TaxID=1848 RepID=A0A1M6X7T6_PSETH|nr:MlaD family protein [Pseudonocardia thermophila]SHL02004.1 phospholipid/cholesterol/gamma-HCH transport system substrate-binding protein [Pseudonocardia thermophila]
MITRRTRLQLIALLVVAVVGVVYTGVRFADLGAVVGATSYPVTLQMSRSGGIFTGADVTYRGVSVGRVGPLALTPDGVEVRLDIDRSAPPIPASVTAQVRNLSAIGEQYVDLLPDTADGPTLQAGSVIRESEGRVEVPVPVEELVASLDDLARSVPLDRLQLVVDELGTAFADTGVPLQRLLDTTGEFTAAAVEALPQTTALIEDARPVLRTLNATSGQFRGFSENLALLAAQLKESDGDLRRVIQYAPPATEELSALLDESGSELGEVIANLLTVTRIAEPRQPGLRQVLVTYPALVAGVLTAVPGDGTGAHLGLVLNVFDPLACVRGYESTAKRPGTDVTEVPVNADAHCAEPASTGINVRGSQNVPRSPTPDAAHPENPDEKNTDEEDEQQKATTLLLVDMTEVPLGSPAQILASG